MRRVLSFSLGTALSRALGLLREVVIAALLGAHDAADAFYVALRLPMMLRDLVAENAALSAFVPAFTEAEERGDPWGFFWGLVLWLFGGLLFVIILGIALAPWVVKLFAWGFGPEKLSLTARLARITFPYLALVSAAALLGALMNVRGRFFLPAASPSAFNAGVVGLGLLALGASLAGRAEALAWGVMLGGFAQVLLLVPFAGLRLSRPSLRHPSLRTFFKLMGPVAVSVGFSRISLFFNTLIASFLGTGAVAYLNYAFRLMQLPLGLFGVGVATVWMPAMAREAAREQDPKEKLLSGERAVLLLTVPAAFALVALAEPALALLFARGSFTGADALKAAQALLLYAPAVPGFSLTKIYLNYFFSRKITRVPNLSFGLAALVNVGFSLALAPVLGFPGLALATSLSAWAQALYLRVKSGAGLPRGLWAGVVAGVAPGVIALSAPGLWPRLWLGLALYLLVYLMLFFRRGR